MRVHTVRLLILFGLILFAAYASHEAETKAQAIWKRNSQTTTAGVVVEDVSPLY
ncbi:MAG TPA: hypothetical protein VKZ68_08145 [Ohtaekwangia sp.]|nr:hypothetical protein [Ohtaekwangia sp.]